MMSCGSLTCCGKHCVDKALLVLRLAAGIIFVLHGWGKLFGGNPGIPAFTGMLASLGFPIPAFFAWLVGIVEFVGGIGLILGVWVQPIAVLLAIIMLIAFITVKKSLPAGDTDLALFGTAVALALAGGGSYALMRRKGASPAASMGEKQ